MTVVNQKPELIDTGPHFNYGLIAPEYHAAGDPDELVTLYRGDILGRGQELTPSRAALNLGSSAVLDQLDAIYNDPSYLDRLINEHTSAHPHSPFVSTTPNPEFAQFWAGKDRAIYKIEVPASRVVMDAHDVGRSGNSGEAFVLGSLLPKEITAVKDPSGHNTAASELYVPEGRYIRNGLYALPFIRASSNRNVKNPKDWRAA